MYACKKQHAFPSWRSWEHTYGTINNSPYLCSQLIKKYESTVNVLKFQNTFLFLFSNKILVIRAGIHKMLVRIANRENPDQTASSESV